MFIHCELLILTLALTLYGQVHTGEIIGGGRAAPHSRPYMVRLELYMEDKTKIQCGGFLLNEDFVMTAAHCQARSYTVLLGVDDVKNSNEIQHISVAQTYPRRDFNSTNYNNDIMLLKLSTKANFNKNVRPIALAGQGDGFLPKSCSVSGWGKTDSNTKSMSNVLMEVNVTLIDDENCAQDNLYCSEGKSGPGSGDSGGPLVCEDGKAYGVVSSNFIPQSGGPEIHRFAKIPDYRHWIDLTMTNAWKKF